MFPQSNRASSSARRHLDVGRPSRTGRTGSVAMPSAGSDETRQKSEKKYPATLQGKVDYLGDLMETHEAQIKQLHNLNEGLKVQGELLQEENNALRESIGNREQELKVTRRMMEWAGILPPGAWEAALQGKFSEDQKIPATFQNPSSPASSDRIPKRAFSSRRCSMQAIISKSITKNKAQEAKETLRNLKADLKKPSSPIGASGFSDALEEPRRWHKRQAKLTTSPSRGKSHSPARGVKPKSRPMKIVVEEDVRSSEDLYAAAKPLLDNTLAKDAQNDVLLTVKALLEKKASPNKWTGPETPIRAAVLAQNIELVQCLLGSRANPNQANNRGVTVVHQAVFDQAEDLCKVLLQGMADPNAGDKCGQTPLFFASTPSFCRLLCGAKADPYVLNQHRQSAMHFAARAGHEDVLVWFAKNVRKRLTDWRAQAPKLWTT